MSTASLVENLRVIIILYNKLTLLHHPHGWAMGLALYICFFFLIFSPFLLHFIKYLYKLEVFKVQVLCRSRSSLLEHNLLYYHILYLSPVPSTLLIYSCLCWVFQTELLVTFILICSFNIWLLKTWMELFFSSLLTPLIWLLFRNILRVFYSS